MTGLTPADRMRHGRIRRTLSGMDSEREYDQDTVGDFDENTLDGSEGLDADVISTDGEDLTVDPPENWKSAEEHHSLDSKLAAERPDTGAEGVLEPGAEGVERHDQIDDLDPEGGTRVLGEA